MVRILLLAAADGAAVRATLESCLGQTFPPAELLIVASRDLALPEGPHLPPAPRIHVLRRDPPLARAAALNLGFAPQGAELVLVLEAGDLLAPAFLEKAVELLRRHPRAAFAYTWSRTVGPSPAIRRCGRWRLQSLLKQELCVAAPLLRRACWLEAGGCDESLPDGLAMWDLWLRFAARDLYGAVVPEPLVISERGSIAAMPPPERQEEWLEHVRRIIGRSAGLFDLHYPTLPGLRRSYAHVRPAPAAPSTGAAAPRAPVPDAAAPTVLFFTGVFGRGGLEASVVQAVREFRARGINAAISADTVASLPPDVPVLPAADLDERRPPRVVISHIQPLRCPALRRPGVPIVTVLHNCYAWVEPEDVRPLAEELRSARACWAVSRAVGRYFGVHFGVPESLIRVMPNPVRTPSPADQGRRREVRKRHAIPEDARLLLFAGRWHPVKGLAPLIEALPAVRREHPGVHLALVGHAADEDYAARVRRKLDRSPDRRAVHVIPWAQDMAAWYAAADLFVLPSMMEGASMAAFEALAAGVPAALTRVGDAEELADATGAVVLLDPPQGTYLDINPENYEWALTAEFPHYPAVLADALCRALENLEALRGRALAASPRLAESRSPARVVDRMMEALAGIGVFAG